jgi:hypothetical protein
MNPLEKYEFRGKILKNNIFVNLNLFVIKINHDSFMLN